MRLTLALRVTTAATLSLALALWLGLPLPLWAVLTAVIVTQMSVGRSPQVCRRLLCSVTLGGALYGGAVAILVLHSHELALLVVLAIAVAPLAVAAAFIRPWLWRR